MSLTIAIDASLAYGNSTGDSSYWTGLIHGLEQLESTTKYLFFYNGALPAGIPENDRMRWIPLPGSNRRLWSLVQFPLAARRAGADLIHAQYNLSPLVGQRGITTIHDVSFFIGPEWFRARDLHILTKFIPRTVKRARAVVTVSETSKREIETFLPQAQGKTFATPLATPTHIQPLAPDQLLRQRRRLDLPEEFLLTIGTRWPRKNTALAIEAANAAKVSLIVTGKAGWGGESLGDYARAIGYVDNDMLNALYQSATLYLLPSRHEGFGLTLLEAFSSGCPVLCSKGGALPEVAGNAAVIEQTWEPGPWAASIQQLLDSSSKLDALREAGRRRAGDFSWRETARLTEEVYLGAMRKSV